MAAQPWYFVWLILLAGCFSWPVYGQNPMSQQYTVGLMQVYEAVTAQSAQLQALKSEQTANRLTLDSVEGYAYPKVSLGSEIKQYYANQEVDPAQSGDLSLKLSSKLYGSAQSDKISASASTLNASDYDVQGLETELYYIVLSSLATIERTRFYLYQSELLAQEMNGDIERLKQAVVEGVSPVSELKEAELIRSRFNDAVYGQTANIEKAFNELALKTGYEVDSPAEVGFPIQQLHELIVNPIQNFNIDDVLQKNLKLNSQKATMMSARFSALSEYETLNVSFNNETHVEVLGSEEVEIGEITGSSFVGLSMNWDLYDYQKSTSQSASLQRYESEKKRYQQEKEKLRSGLVLLKDSYDSLFIKRENLINQIKLNRGLIQNQKNEVFADKVTFLDLIKSISSFNQLYISLLDIDVQIYQKSFEYWEYENRKVFN